MTSAVQRRTPTTIERGGLYQLAKDAASLSLDQPYNAARAALWDVKWLDHRAADEIAGQASERMTTVRENAPDGAGWLKEIWQVQLASRVPNELEGLRPAPGGLTPHT